MPVVALVQRPWLRQLTRSFSATAVAVSCVVAVAPAQAQDSEQLLEQSDPIVLAGFDTSVGWTQHVGASNAWQVVLDRSGVVTRHYATSYMLGDLGLGPAGRVVSTFSRCSRPVEISIAQHLRTGCDIYLRDFAAKRTIRVPGASSRHRVEFSPTVWGRNLVFGDTPEFPTKATQHPRLYVVDLLARHPRPRRIPAPSGGVDGPNCPRFCFSGPGPTDLRGHTLAYVWTRIQPDPDFRYIQVPRVYMQRLGSRPRPVSADGGGYAFLTADVTPDQSSVSVLRRVPRVADNTEEAVMSFAPGRNGSVLTTLPAPATQVAFTTSYLYWVENRTKLDIPVRSDFALLRRRLQTPAR